MKRDVRFTPRLPGTSTLEGVVRGVAGKGWLGGLPRCVVPMLVRGSDTRVLMVEVVVVVVVVEHSGREGPSSRSGGHGGCWESWMGRRKRERRAFYRAEADAPGSVRREANKGGHCSGPRALLLARVHALGALAV